MPTFIVSVLVAGGEGGGGSFFSGTVTGACFGCSCFCGGGTTAGFAVGWATFTGCGTGFAAASFLADGTGAGWEGGLGAASTLGAVSTFCADCAGIKEND